MVGLIMLDDRKSRFKRCNRMFHYPNGLEKSFLCKNHALNQPIHTLARFPSEIIIIDWEMHIF